MCVTKEEDCSTRKKYTFVFEVRGVDVVEAEKSQNFDASMTPRKSHWESGRLVGLTLWKLIQ